MAEQEQTQDPVVVSSDDVAAGTRIAAGSRPATAEEKALGLTPRKVTSEEAARQAVTGEEGIDPKSGLPRITIAPMALQPTPQAMTEEIGGLDVQLSPKPKVEFKRLGKERVQEEAQRLRTDEPLTMEGVLSKLQAGENVDLQTPDGVMTYTPEYLKLIDENPQLKSTIEIQTQQDTYFKKQARKEKPADVTIAYVGPSGETDVSRITDPNERNLAEDYAENRKRLNAALLPVIKGGELSGRPDIDVAVRQYFIDDFETGGVLNNLASRLAETGRAIPTMPSYALGLLAGAIDADMAARQQGTDFSDEWAARAEDRERVMRNLFEFIDEYIPAPTAAMWINDAIRERAKKDLDAGKLTPEQYDDFIYDRDITGEKFERRFVDDEAAYAALEASFDELSGAGAFTTIFFENVLGGGFLSGMKSAAITAEMRNLERIRKAYKIPLAVKLEAIPAWLANKGIKEKLDNNLLQLGFYTRSTKKQSFAASKRMDDIVEEKKALTPGSLEYERLDAEYDNLKRLQNRNYVRQKISPLALQVVRDEAIMAGAAALGREYMTGMFGMDADMAEMAGVISNITIGKPVRWLGKGVYNIGRSFTGFNALGGLRHPISAPLRKLMQADMSVEDYERLYYMPENDGKPMSYRERRAVARAFKEVDKMNPTTREEFLGVLREQNQLQENIIDSFPEGEARDTARKLFEQSFAETMDLPSFMSAFQASTETLSFKTLRKGGLQRAVESAVAMDAKRLRAKAALDNFEKHAATYADPAKQEAIVNLIKQTREGLIRVEESIQEQLDILDNTMGVMLDAVAGDPSIKLPKTFFDDYIEAKTVMNGLVSPETAGELQSQISRVKVVKEVVSKANAGLLNQFKIVKSIRSNKQMHRQALSSTAEKVLSLQYAKLYKQMDANYDGFREFVANTIDERPRIDISDAVAEMLRLASADEKNIKTFFSPEATFFAGYLGKKSRKMFERMVQRTLEDLPEDELAQMVSSIKEASEGKLKAEDIADMMQGNPTQFGLFLHQHGKLNVFANATIDEAEEFRRAFRDYGYKTNNPAVAREYKNFEKIINKAMKDSDEVGYTELEKARGIHQGLNDPMRKGTPMQQFLSSHVGDKVELDSSPFSGLYKNKTPDQILSGLGNAVKKAMRGGPGQGEALAEMRKQIGYMEQLFGTPTVTGGKAIDLRTEEGRQALQMIQELTDAIVYDEWAADFLTKQPSVGGQIGDPRGLGFKTSVINELSDLNEALKINVIDESGKFNPDQLALDLVGMVAQERDIANYIQKGGRFYEQGKAVIQRLRRTIEKVSKEATRKANSQRAAYKTLTDITGLQNPLQFYDKYINGLGDLDALKLQFLEYAKRDPNFADVSPDDIEGIFNEAIYKLTYQGLIEYGGYQATSKLSGVTKKAFGGLLKDDEIVVKEFTNALGLVAQITSDNTRRNLLKVMPQEQIDSLKNIAIFLANQKTAAIAKEGVARGMSANEAISRAYNIARGMVGTQYIASEVAVRMIEKHASDTFMLAIQSPDAARLIDKMLRFPKLMKPEELKTLDILLVDFFATDVVRKAQQESTLAYFDQYEKGDQNETK